MLKGAAFQREQGESSATPAGEARHKGATVGVCSAYERHVFVPMNIAQCIEH